MKIAITGGSGHVGTALIYKLLDLGHEVKALIHEREGAIGNLKIEKLRGSTTELADVEQLVSDVDVVIHLAALISISGDCGGLVQKINVGGTKNVVDACIAKGVKKLIHVSSIHAYQPYPHDIPLDETRGYVGKDSYAYDFSKATAQQYVLDAVKNKGLDAVVLNPTGIIGPFDYLNSPKFKMLYQFYYGQIPILTPGGFDWVDNRDVADGIIAAIDKGRVGEAYLLSGKYYTVKELSAIIGKVLNKKTPQMMMTFGVLNLLLPFVGLWGKITRTEPLYTEESLAYLKEGHPTISYQKAAKDLGYSPRPIEETLKDTYDWMKKEGFIR